MPKLFVRNFNFLAVAIVVGTGSGAAHAQKPAVAGQEAGQVLQADFRGQIIYDGSYEGEMTTPRRMPRNLNLGNLVDAATRDNSENFRGGTRYVVEYDGDVVRGSFQEQGSFNDSGTFTGTRRGSECAIVSNVGIRMTATCDRNGFNSNLDFTDPQGRRFSSVIQTNRTSFTDYAERDRLAAVAAENARIAAADAATRRASVPAPPSDVVDYFDQLIATDASSWMMNRYDRGSMHNMRVDAVTNNGRTRTVYGDYTYNGGLAGWVRAQFTDDNLDCLEYWDFSGQCRPLGQSPSRGMAAGFAGAMALGMMSDTGGSSGGEECDDACEFYTLQQQDATYREYHPQ